jgi:hypothetical protein
MPRSFRLTVAAGTFTCVFALATGAIAGKTQCAAGSLSAIEGDVASAERALARDDYARANEFAGAAIKKIGDRYASPNVIDDTGQRLSLADWRQRDGDLKAAANIRVRMAGSRLEALRRKPGC